MQLNTRKTSNPIKKWAKDLTDSFPKKIYRWLINTWKYAKHHSLLEKCKSKPQWGIISHWSECPSLKSLQTINAGEGIEKGSLLHCCSVQSLNRVCLCDPMNHSTPGLPVHHQLPESTQTHMHWPGDAIQPSHPLLSPSPPALNLSQHQGLFKWVSSLHQVAKVLSFSINSNIKVLHIWTSTSNQSFQWTPRTDLL